MGAAWADPIATRDRIPGLIRPLDTCSHRNLYEHPFVEYTSGVAREDGLLTIIQALSTAADDTDLLFTLPEPVAPEARQWVGIDLPLWTDNKAQLIVEYLRLFQLVTHHGTYIDGFAGPQRPEWADRSAASLALAMEPKWFRHFHLCDRSRAQVARLRELQKQYPERDVQVYPGDFNRRVTDILVPGVLKREATFCLLDQRTFECDWATLEALAAVKQPRIELFYFLAQGWLDRSFSGLRQRGRERVRAWWGRDDWPKLAGMQAFERAELVARRIRDELGYEHVTPWPIYGRDEGGRLMYHMIHATDHPDAPNLMRRAYNHAVTAPVGEQIPLVSVGPRLSKAAIDARRERLTWD
jgi:three-Cys-motif partner protein